MARRHDHRCVSGRTGAARRGRSDGNAGRDGRADRRRRRGLEGRRQTGRALRPHFRVDQLPERGHPASVPLRRQHHGMRGRLQAETGPSPAPAALRARRSGRRRRPLPQYRARRLSPRQHCRAGGGGGRSRQALSGKRGRKADQHCRQRREPWPCQRPRDRGLAAPFAARHRRGPAHRRRGEPAAGPEGGPDGAVRCAALDGERIVPARHRVEGRPDRYPRQCQRARTAARGRDGCRRLRGSRPDRRQPRRGLKTPSPDGPAHRQTMPELPCPG